MLKSLKQKTDTLDFKFIENKIRVIKYMELYLNLIKEQYISKF